MMVAVIIRSSKDLCKSFVLAKKKRETNNKLPHNIRSLEKNNFWREKKNLWECFYGLAWNLLLRISLLELISRFLQHMVCKREIESVSEVVVVDVHWSSFEEDEDEKRKWWTFKEKVT